jgi:hypothetical protein
VAKTWIPLPTELKPKASISFTRELRCANLVGDQEKNIKPLNNFEGFNI